MLISLSGLPGTGKTTVASLAAGDLRAVYLRIDSIERLMRRTGLAVEGVGYEVGQAVAADNLARPHPHRGMCQHLAADA